MERSLGGRIWVIENYVSHQTSFPGGSGHLMSLALILREGLTSMTVAGTPLPGAFGSEGGANNQPHSNPQVSPVLLKELTNHFSGTGIPLATCCWRAAATSSPWAMPTGDSLASCGVSAFFAYGLLSDAQVSSGKTRLTCSHEGNFSWTFLWRPTIRFQLMSSSLNTYMRPTVAMSG
jgi:hypothetical protein